MVAALGHKFRRSEPQLTQLHLRPSLLAAGGGWGLAHHQHAPGTNQPGCTLGGEAWRTERPGHRDIVRFSSVGRMPEVLCLDPSDLHPIGQTEAKDGALDLVSPRRTHVDQRPVHVWPHCRQCHPGKTASGTEIDPSRHAPGLTSAARTNARDSGQNGRKAGAMRQLIFEVPADRAQAVGALQRGQQVASELGCHSSSSLASVANKTM